MWPTRVTKWCRWALCRQPSWLHLQLSRLIQKFAITCFPLSLWESWVIWSQSSSKLVSLFNTIPFLTHESRQMNGQGKNCSSYFLLVFDISFKKAVPQFLGTILWRLVGKGQVGCYCRGQTHKNRLGENIIILSSGFWTCITYIITLKAERPETACSS